MDPLQYSSGDGLAMGKLPLVMVDGRFSRSIALGGG
jgi:hypothetical protein